MPTPFLKKINEDSPGPPSGGKAGIMDQQRADRPATAPPARVPVLIAGGGPVGLAAAMELSRHGVA